MEVDKLFVASYPGIREFFFNNALSTFVSYLIGVFLLMVLVFAVLTFHKKNEVQSRAVNMIMVFTGLGTAMLLIIVLNSISANSKVEKLNYTALGIQYLVPAGAIVLAVLCIALFVMCSVYRRKYLLNNLNARMTQIERRENMKGYLFITPYLIGFTAFIAIPLAFSLFSSFTYYNITAVQKWYGAGNYTSLFTGDKYFWKSLYNTLYYVVFSVPLVIIVSMALALLLNLKVKGMKLFRTVYYLPSVLSGVAVFLLWQWIFDPNAGLLNNGLALLGIHGPAWLFDAATTKPAMIIMRLWGTGSTTIILLAALQGVSKDLYEAGDIDGAKGFKKFFYITLPMISPTIFFVMITGISSAFQIFDQAYIMTDGTGGPSQSLLFYNFYLFNTAFQDMLMGKASAMAWILFIIIMLFTIIQTVASRKWVHYEGGKE